MKKTFYFSHDYNAQFDEKILKLRRKLGMEGYGIYWAVIERLASNNGKLSLNSIDDIAYDLHIDNNVITQVITDFSLFIIDENNSLFWNKRLLEHFEKRDDEKKKKSEAGKKGMAKRWAKDNNVITDNNTTITENNKIKENKIKENKIKENKIKENKKEKLNFSLEKNVKLTQEEFNKLGNLFSYKIRNEYIEKLSLYLLKNKNKKYESHYLTIRSWLNNAGIKAKDKEEITAGF